MIVSCLPPPIININGGEGGGIGELKTLYDGTQFDTYKDKIWVIATNKEGHDYIETSTPTKLSEEENGQNSVLEDLQQDGNGENNSSKVIVAPTIWNNQSPMDTFFLLFESMISIKQDSAFFLYTKSQSEQDIEIRLIQKDKVCIEEQEGKEKENQLIKCLFNKVKNRPIDSTEESAEYSIIKTHLPSNSINWIDIYQPCNTNNTIGDFYCVLVCSADWKKMQLLKFQYV